MQFTPSQHPLRQVPDSRFRELNKGGICGRIRLPSCPIDDVYQ